MKQRTRQRMVSLWMIVALFVVALPSPSVAAEKIVLVGSEGTKASFTGKWLNLIYTEVFRRLGYELEYKGYPNERANAMAESGVVDGEIQRAASYQKISKNLIRVEEPSFSGNVSAYAVTPGIVVDGWESLKNTNYSVEYRRGSKLPQTVLPEFVRPEKLSTISTVEQGLKKLIAGRTDIFIEQELVVDEALREFDKAGFDYSSLYQAGIVYTGNSYLYMHKRHAALVPKIAEVLRNMKQQGVVERYKEIIQKTQ
jgi:polar amino acid transport system substrate-binding protein